jgi:tetraacyldisaccharide 4'-kinase
VCVGNLTSGGSGKTPVAIAAAQILAKHGKTVFLTRGYGGRLSGPVVVDPGAHSARDTGDEPLLLAQWATTIVSRDRAAGARLADSLEAAFIVMDDGFQNFGLAKDLALLVVDAETGLGNGKLIPAGPLRESAPSGLARANAIVVVGDGSPKLPPFDGTILRAKLIPERPEWLKGRKVMAFAGIGRPSKFFHMLEAYGIEPAGTASFGDHHVFTPTDIAQMKQRAVTAGASLVTTMKDFVRLHPSDRSGIFPVPVRAEFDHPVALDVLLSQLANAPEVM